MARWILDFGRGAAGGLVFWLPDVILHGTRPDFGSKEVGTVTWLLPFLAMTTLVTLRVLDGKASHGRIATSVLLGIWILGPLAMMAGATFSGGGFAGSGALEPVMVLFLIGLIPPMTFIFSTYDGSLFALLLASALIVIVIVEERLNLAPGASG